MFNVSTLDQIRNTTGGCGEAGEEEVLQHLQGQRRLKRMIIVYGVIHQIRNTTGGCGEAGEEEVLQHPQGQRRLKRIIIVYLWRPFLRTLNSHIFKMLFAPTPFETVLFPRPSPQLEKFALHAIGSYIP